MRRDYDRYPERWVLRTCEICGKQFQPAVYHQYVDYMGGEGSAKRYYCSYTCYLQRPDEKDDGRRHQIQQYTEGGVLVAEYQCARDAVLALADEGVETTINRIQAECRGERKAKTGYIFKYKYKEKKV